MFVCFFEIFRLSFNPLFIFDLGLSFFSYLFRMYFLKFVSPFNLYLYTRHFF
ncbi:hypothetical protein GLOIN_2v1554860 [Rhizophagus irregularis DAOM 181602=DAOM 197198]|uniref:Uncharacterized protein n=1 Tax=Rhizophagus irregularis (strain DAOM 181602 / DAOM 197198 / MUCL 43194) TaxID=747089 RepID=A0A2P4QGA3_RHIID|nr:hypothetical protein GLOIN_2v1554860 [Rhizophagus irregularis DAOM 181602=DAOM 197198]POG76664.1 hypothetical protein GLOIN_2v1554860 [Rhizophagus irregularis DAOM 181602=DAOM 197198]|eukprot:XP_025183530.1 hypothetical protein GLOIN_2v1554860 [Rhizophagus irregularis DAOM 181602=DAOM 197198]